MVERRVNGGCGRLLTEEGRAVTEREEGGEGERVYMCGRREKDKSAEKVGLVGWERVESL